MRKGRWRNWQRDGLLIRRFRVRVPGGPLLTSTPRGTRDRKPPARPRTGGKGGGEGQAQPAQRGQGEVRKDAHAHEHTNERGQDGEGTAFQAGNAVVRAAQIGSCVRRSGGEVPGVRDDSSSLRGGQVAPFALRCSCKGGQREVASVVVDPEGVLSYEISHRLPHRSVRIPVL